jgi:hypothetical protein
MIRARLHRFKLRDVTPNVLDALGYGFLLSASSLDGWSVWIGLDICPVTTKDPILGIIYPII